MLKTGLEAAVKNQYQTFARSPPDGGQLDQHLLIDDDPANSNCDPDSVQDADQDSVPQSFCEWYMRAPIGNLPVAITMLGGGFAAAGVVTNFFLPIGLLLWAGIAATGLLPYAAYQMYRMGIFKDMLNKFEKLNKQLRHEANRFKEENNRFERENKRLKSTAKMFQDNNDTLKEQNSKLQGSVEQLSAVKQSMESNQSAIQSEVDKLQGLKDSLSQYASTSGEDLQKTLERVEEQFGKLKDITKHYERLMVEKVAQDIEFMDHSEGLSEKEFERFRARLPSRISIKVEKKGKGFADIKARNSDVIHYDELADYIDSLLNSPSISTQTSASRTPLKVTSEVVDEEEVLDLSKLHKDD